MIRIIETDHSGLLRELPHITNEATTHDVSFPLLGRDGVTLAIFYDNNSARGQMRRGEEIVGEISSRGRTQEDARDALVYEAQNISIPAKR